MATTPNTLTSSEYWMSPDALTIELNALDNPQYLQVSLLAGSVITAYRQDVIDYDATLNFRKWNLQAYNNFFDRTDRAYVYAQLDKDGDTALIIYSYDMLELVGTATDSSGDSKDVYNVYLATISPAVNDAGEEIMRTWETAFETGSLNTDKNRQEEQLGEWSKMFRLNKVTDMIEVLKDMTSAVIHKLYIGARKILVTDVYTSSEEDLSKRTDDQTLPTTKYLTDYTGSNFLSKTKEDVTNFLLKLLGGVISPFIQSPDYVSGAMGAGFTLKQNEDGSSYAEVDKLLVRMKAVFQTLEILKTELGGSSFLFNASGARATLTKVEKLESEAYFIDGDKAYFPNDDEVYFPDVYRCYFMVDDGDTAVENLFKVGDLVRSQTFNIEAGIHEGVSNHYWWRLVVGKGKDYIDISSVDMDEGSDEPAEGDVIVQLGNIDDIDRQAAIVMSAYGDGAPSLTMYQGINSYSLSGKDIFSIGYDRVNQECLVKIFGSGFWGARDETSFIKFNQKTKKFDIKANVEVLGGFNDTIAQNLGYSDYKQMIEEAAQGKTIIKGGYINTEVLDAKTIITSDLISSAIKTKELNVNDKFIVDTNGILTAEGADIKGKIIADSGEFNDGTFTNCIFNSLRSNDNAFVYDSNGLKLTGELKTGSEGEYVIVGKNGSGDIRQYDGLGREVANLAIYQENNYQTARSRLILNQWSQGDGSISSLTCELKPGELYITDKSNNTASFTKDFISFKDSNGEYYGQTGSIDVITELQYDFNGRVTGGTKGKLYFKGGIIYGKE